MSKQVYISADYAESDGDRDVVDELVKWGLDNKHSVDFIDMSHVASGSVDKDDDCRICDLKAEFNRQINASFAVICIIGDKTKDRIAGNACDRVNTIQILCECTPYKQNTNGKKSCKIRNIENLDSDEDISRVNTYSYLRHEFEQARKKNKKIIILYNSTRKEQNWLPSYMSDYKDNGHPFWKYDDNNKKVGDYSYIKEVLEF